MPKSFRFLSLHFALFLASFVAAAEPTPLPFLSPIFGDDMVLQRDKPNTFWGWTTPGAEVCVSIGSQSARATAGSDGRWQVRIDPPPVGTTCTVAIEGPERVELKNVIVGDVWLCGGQSNMGVGLPGSSTGAEAVAAADLPEIRLFKVGVRAAYSPVAAPAGRWQVCTPESVSERGGFSAVGFFFARRVHAETGVPIGLVQDCLGGSPAESWMSPETLAAMPDFEKPMAEVDRLHRIGAQESGSFLMSWLDEHDAGVSGTTWADPAIDDGDWKTTGLATAFTELGLEGGPAVVWFRREIELPDPLPEGRAVLHLGVVEKMDTAYINGQWVGASSWVENPRSHRIPAGVLRPGRNLIAIRVFKLRSKNGFLSDPATLRIALSDGAHVPLDGVWKVKLSVDARPPHELPLGYENYPTMPSVLYRGMIEPVAPLAIRGALWYQGEANANRAFQYRTLLPAMIGDWRRVFGQGDFPFYIVSLPLFQARKDKPGTDDWAELREAQALTAAYVPNTGLAVTIDTGDPKDIHPGDKQPVGERLALLALKDVYDRDVVAHGPRYRSMERTGSEIRLHFDHTDGGLQVNGEKLGEFSVAGADKQWRWAGARIDGDTVVVHSPEVPEPVAVRYAWQANPLATLVNGLGLPAAPFRTDDWPGVTEGRAPY